MNILQLKSGNPKWRLANGLKRPLFDDEPVEIVTSEFNFKGVFDSNDFFRTLDKKLFDISEYEKLIWAIGWRRLAK